VNEKMNANILIVEDDRDCAATIAMILTQEQYGVREVASRDAALSILDSYLYDVIIMDLFMPGLGPKEFISEVRRRHARSEIILLTAADIVPKAVKDLELLHWLGKPFQPDDLVKTVRRCLESKNKDEARNDPGSADAPGQQRHGIQ
jgi:DNA-binding response OmpR family regulator